MTHHWLNTVDKGQSVRTAFVDFAKAVDRVDHDILMAKMCPLDLVDIIICWMCSFLRHRRQQIVIRDVMSDWKAGQYQKRQKMFISSTLKDIPPSLTLSGEAVEKVATFKLLGVHVSNDLKWAQHIQPISVKGASIS